MEWIPGGDVYYRSGSTDRPHASNRFHQDEAIYSYWAYEGRDQVTNYFQEEVSVLYQRWLGRHYSFYIFGLPLDLRWCDSPSKLAEEASQEANEGRYIVFPSWKSEAEVRVALAEEELAFYPLHQIRRRDGSLSFTIYEIEEMAQSERREN